MVDPSEILEPDWERGRRRRRGRGRRRRGGKGRRSGGGVAFVSVISPSSSFAADDLDVAEEPRPLVPEHALELVRDVLRVLVVWGDARADEAEGRRELVLSFFPRFFPSGSSPRSRHSFSLSSPLSSFSRCLSYQNIHPYAVPEPLEQLGGGVTPGRPAADDGDAEGV